MIFGDKRRELIAKTIMDLAKIQGAAAIATTFFEDLPIKGRILMAALFVGSMILGMLIQPESKDDKER